MTRKSQSGRDCPHLSERVPLEPALTLREPSRDITVWAAVFSRIFLKLRKAVRMEVRTGYQDETGFHNGIKPSENEIQWPPVL
jgi:hypothetical protein